MYGHRILETESFARSKCTHERTKGSGVDKLPTTTMVLKTFLVVLLFCLKWIDGLHFGLFAGLGCYSHDMLMKNLADSILEAGHRVTLIQVRVYDGPAVFDTKKTAAEAFAFIHRNGSTDKTIRTIRQATEYIWNHTIPLDPMSFNPEGTRLLASLQKTHSVVWHKTFKDAKFLSELRALKLDLMVIDYILNEGGVVVASLLKVPFVFFSNYPVPNGYSGSLGLPTPPSYVPNVVANFARGANFEQRAHNSLLNVLLYTAHDLFLLQAEKVFRANAIDVHNVAAFETDNLIGFVTPMEFMTEVSRPFLHNLMYTGCVMCQSKQKNTADIVNSKSNAVEVSTVTFENRTRLCRQLIAGLFCGYYGVMLMFVCVFLGNAFFSEIFAHICSSRWCRIVYLISRAVGSMWIAVVKKVGWEKNTAKTGSERRVAELAFRRSVDSLAFRSQLDFFFQYLGYETVGCGRPSA